MGSPGGAGATRYGRDARSDVRRTSRPLTAAPGVTRTGLACSRGFKRLDGSNRDRVFGVLDHGRPRPEPGAAVTSSRVLHVLASRSGWYGGVPRKIVSSRARLVNPRGHAGVS